VRTRPGIVVVGAGLAAARVIESYREAGGGDVITLVGAEAHPPYHRPPLTKRLLRGELDAADTFAVPRDRLAELDVDVRSGVQATSLDAARRRVGLATGAEIAFERLVIATGALPHRLPVPGAQLAGVFTLRTLGDALAIRDAAVAGARAVVVGTGFIGLEVSASLRARGVDVTIVGAARTPFDSLGSTEFSLYLEELYREHGVELLLGDGVRELRGRGRIESVLTASGREIEADLAVVGIGVAPAVSWLEGSGVRVDDGVVVDSSFRASAHGVYAIGDVARFHDPVFGRSRRVEHWSNADYHGRELGRILAGRGGGYDRVSAFFTELFGSTYKVLGDPAGARPVEVEGSFRDGAALLRYMREGRVCAALVTGQTPEREAELLEQIRREAAPWAVAA
jgi:3-phenylpropionate/trans-cinnamate dioxygenase ferredoxin reductase component